MRRVALVNLAALAVLTVGLLGGLATLEGDPRDRRLAAEARWERLALANYRIAVAANLSGARCLQDLEVRGGRTVTTLRDTCNHAWLGQLTVARLFELSQRLEQPPSCFPWAQNCMCRRVRIGRTDYEPAQGYPRSVAWRRELQPNLLHRDYWARLWQIRDLPACGPLKQHLQITVLNLTPLP